MEMVSVQTHSKGDEVVEVLEISSSHCDRFVWLRSSWKPQSGLRRSIANLLFLIEFR